MSKKLIYMNEFIMDKDRLNFYVKKYNLSNIVEPCDIVPKNFLSG
jgi:hypothetical protein